MITKIPANIIKTTIPAKYKGFFKKELIFDPEDRKLVVVTGLNGSGKTTILSHLYREKREKEPSSVFFKTTNPNSRNEIRRSDGFIRFRNSRERFSEQESLTIEDIWVEINRRFVHFCSRKKIYYSDLLDVNNMLFNKDSDLYEYGFDFLYEVTNLLFEMTGEQKDVIAKTLGITREDDVKTEIKNRIQKISRLNKNKKEFKNIFLEYENGLKIFEREGYEPKYIGNYSDYNHRINLRDIDQEIRKKLRKEARDKSKITNPFEFDEYIYKLINPFQSMEAIIDKISRKIEDQKNEKRRGGRSYWEQINEEITNLNTEFGDKKFRYLLNPPTRKKYELTFYSHNKDCHSEYISFQNLSSGEKMIFELICYYFVICKDDNSKDAVNLIILDEFDANLNPALAELYLKTINKEFVEKNIKVILTTHSPSTVAEVDPKSLCEIINEDGCHKIEWAKNEDGKKKILEKLAPKFVYDEELGPIGAIKGSRDVIIFVEGKDDEQYFSTKAEELGLTNYKFIECGCADNVPTAIKALSIIPYFQKIIQTKTIIGLFDFDEKGLDTIHRAILRDKEDIKTITQNLRNKKQAIIHEYHNSYLLVLVPPNSSESWQDHFNNRYRLEELKNDEKNNGGAIDRLFAEIKKIVSQSKLK